MTAAAVVASLEEHGVGRLAKLQLKFVNDVFLNGKKVCGVLSKCETIPHSDNFKLMIGIGVNLNTLPHHYSDLRVATSVLIETGMRVSIADFAETLAKNLLSNFDILET